MPFFPTRYYEAVEYAKAHPKQLTIDNVLTWMMRLSSEDAPRFAEELIGAMRMPSEVRTTILANAWSRPHFPENILASYEWIQLFDEVGFAVDGKPAPAPTEPLTLFRGATEAGKEGMSWTTDRAVAERFASGMVMREPGQVWTATVPPHALLANINGREEAEWVVQPDNLGDVRAG